jgi:hypothetical protein
VNSGPEYISHATVVVSFPLDSEIRYKVGDVERNFQSIVGGQASGTNVADSAPPPIPRFTMQSGPKQIAVSQISAQLDMEFSNANKPIDNTLAIIKRNAVGFWEGAKRLKSLDEITEVGIILTMNSTSKLSQADMAREIDKRFLKVPSLGEIASVQLQVGYIDTEKLIFFNVSVGTYELREGPVNQRDAKGGRLTLDIGTLSVKEIGYEVKFDVNSKPLHQAKKIPSAELGQVIYLELENLLLTRGREYLAWQ